MRVLVTGGAGSIGSHLVDALVATGHDVRVFDCLEPQVHGSVGRLPSYLNDGARYIWGDVRERDALNAALAGPKSYATRPRWSAWNNRCTRPTTAWRRPHTSWSRRGSCNDRRRFGPGNHCTLKLTGGLPRKTGYTGYTD